MTWARERIFVVLRTPVPPKDSEQARLINNAPEYEFEAIVTSDEESSTLDIFRAYNHGAEVENRRPRIRQASQPERARPVAPAGAVYRPRPDQGREAKPQRRSPDSRE